MGIIFKWLDKNWKMTFKLAMGESFQVIGFVKEKILWGPLGCECISSFIVNGNQISFHLMQKEGMKGLEEERTQCCTDLLAWLWSNEMEHQSKILGEVFWRTNVECSNSFVLDVIVKSPCCWALVWPSSNPCFIANLSVAIKWAELGTILWNWVWWVQKTFAWWAFRGWILSDLLQIGPTTSWPSTQTWMFIQWSQQIPKLASLQNKGSKRASPTAAVSNPHIQVSSYKAVQSQSNFPLRFGKVGNLVNGWFTLYSKKSFGLKNISTPCCLVSLSPL